MLLTKNRIVIVTGGMYAGRKALIIGGHNERIDVVGVSKMPKPVHDAMNPRIKQRKQKMKVFHKRMNPKHLFFTQYSGDIGIKLFSDSSTTKEMAEKVFRSKMDDKKYAWFFKKLEL